MDTGGVSQGVSQGLYGHRRGKSGAVWTQEWGWGGGG